jgi:hypothetical protein
MELSPESDGTVAFELAGAEYAALSHSLVRWSGQADLDWTDPDVSALLTISAQLQPEVRLPTSGTVRGLSPRAAAMASYALSQFGEESSRFTARLDALRSLQNIPLQSKPHTQEAVARRVGPVATAMSRTINARLYAPRHPLLPPAHQ